MYNPKILSIFNNLEKQSSHICAEVDGFVGNILEWADELVGIVEKEFAAGKESALFLLPKTPSEKKARGKKARNAGVSKCSIMNSTFLQSETSNLDETVSSRTRGARRIATSKISQLNVTRGLQETKQESLVVENNQEDASNATFVLPMASTRTKPVLKNKQPEAVIPEHKSPEPQNNKIQVLNVSNENSDKAKKNSKIGGTPPERPSKRKISNALSESPAERQSTKEAPFIVNETPEERLTRRKKSKTLSGSPAERSNIQSVFRTLSGSPIVRNSSVVVPRTCSKSPVKRSSSLGSARIVGSSPTTRFSKRNSRSNTSLGLDRKSNILETQNSLGNRTLTIKKELTPKAASTFIVLNETSGSLVNDDERTPLVKENKFFKLSKTSNASIDVEKTPVADPKSGETELDENLTVKTRLEDAAGSIKNATASANAEELTRKPSEEPEIPKKKRKLKKDEEVKENIQEVADTVRITRTKSKAIKQMMEENETKQADLSAFAKKLLNRAKMTSMKKNQLAALLECNSSTPTNGPGQLGSGLPFGNLTTSKSKYHLLLSGSKKLKTPLATLPNSAVKIIKASGDKDRSKPKLANRDSSAENAVRTISKLPKGDFHEKEIKLKSKKEKEEEATLKRQNVIKSKQEELKRKNELKHQMAMKQREKLEQEKYYNMVQSEKEKEERHKLILQERQMKLKEEAFKKKMLTQQKIAETVERRRMEEEARIAKLKEMEAEEQRLALEKQKEQERQEKRAQERLAQKKAREEYEIQLKQELEAERVRAEKLLTAKKGMPSANKLQSGTKRQKFGIVGEKREWDYKPRNENDYGLEDEHSEVDSEDEKSYDKAKPAVLWGKKVMHGKSPVVKILTLEMLCEFMPCYQKSPDIYKMFKMTPSKRIKRSSSAIWNTPSS